jgi:hypothetical protein
MTAMLLLTFNSMQRPQHDQASFDSQLVDRGLQMLDQIAEETQSEVVRSFRKTCAELHLDAQRKGAEASVMANTLNLSTYSGFL